MTEEQEQLFQEALEILRHAPLIILDNLFTWDESRLAMLYHIYSHKTKCIVVDYVQNIAGNKSDSEYDSLNRIVRELQRTAVSQDVFICALSQINRDSARSDDDRVFGFKGSGNLENAADVAMTLRWFDPENKADFRRILTVGKNRNGDTGEIKLRTDYSYGLIKDATEETWV